MARLWKFLLFQVFLLSVLINMYLLLIPKYGTGKHTHTIDTGTTKTGLYTEDSYNVRPVRGGGPGNTRPSMADRLTLLEKKFASHVGWVKQPHAWKAMPGRCKNKTCIGDCDRNKEHVICFDDIPKPCVVYDFGIRQQPEFGVYFAKQGCEVHAFDPTPVTLKWIESSGLKKLPNYHFHPYGAGGVDGNITVYEYSWGQHSIVRPEPMRIINNKKSPWVYPDPEDDAISIPVKPLDVIMKSLGHSEITILKLDVEGSEWMMLEAMFDTMGCPPFRQLNIEWHHFDVDATYGSVPRLNNIMNLFADCGLKQFWANDYFYQIFEYGKGGWKDMAYLYASFIKDS